MCKHCENQVPLASIRPARDIDVIIINQVISILLTTELFGWQEDLEFIYDISYCPICGRKL